MLCTVAKYIRLTFNFFFGMVDSLFNKHRLVRRSIVLFAIYEINYAIKEALPRLENGELVTSLLGVIAMLATVLGFYTIERNRDK